MSKMKTKGIAPLTAAARTAWMLPESIKAAPRAPRMTPQPILRLVGGLSDPSLVSMPSTKVALSTLVTRKTNSKNKVMAPRTSARGRRSKSENRATVRFSSTICPTPPPPNMSS